MQKVNFHHINLLYFRSSKKASPSARETCSKYTQNAVSNNTVRRGFKKLKSKIFIFTRYFKFL